MALLGLFVLGLVLAGLGPTAFAAGLALAVLPLPVYLALALWIDRYEKEPFGMLALAFGWGATVAAFLSFVLNSVNQAVFATVGGAEAAEFGAAVLSAPVVEEVAKAGALFLLFFWRIDEFDNVTDGILYAAMVGLGFATVENVAYYGAAVAAGSDAPAAVLVLRGVLSPFSHPLFTAMVGIGLGVARERGGREVWPPILGLGGAVALHVAWNLSAVLGAVFFAAYLGLMVPAFVGLLVVVSYSLGRERAILREHLAACVDDGTLSTEAFDALCSVSGRRRLSWRAFRRGGLPGWRRHRRMHRAAAELAFHRWREDNGRVVDGGAGEARRLERLKALARPPVVGALALALAGALACGGGEEVAEEPAPPEVGDRVVRGEAPPAAGPVEVAGRVVDGRTGEGIAGAYVIALDPAVSLEEFEASGGEDVEGMMAAAVVTDSTGAYRLPGLPRGHDYTVMIAARGYRSAAFRDGLTVEPDAPALKAMDPVALEPGVW